MPAIEPARASILGAPGAPGAPDLAEVARAEGYLLLPGLLSPAPVLAARARLLDACARRGWLRPGAPAADYHDPDWVSLQAELLPSPEIARLAADAALQQALAAVLGARPRRLGADVIRVAFPGPGARPTPPHQDANYLPDPATWIAWLPLDDCPLDRGPLALVPGSHAGGLRPHEGPTLDERVAEARAGDRWVAAAMRPGDALLFSALTLHRALDNRSDRLRLSVDLRFGAG